MVKCVVVFTLVALACSAQTVPVTTRRGRPQQTGISPLETPAATFHGTVKTITKKELVLALPEDHEVTFYISHKTKFLKDSKPVKFAELAEGTAITVDGKRDVRGNTEAVTVSVDPPAKPRPAEQSDLPAPIPTGDAPPK